MKRNFYRDGRFKLKMDRMAGDLILKDGASEEKRMSRKLRNGLVYLEGRRRQIIANRRLLEQVKRGHLMTPLQAGIIREIFEEQQRAHGLYGNHHATKHGTGEHFWSAAQRARALCGAKMDIGRETMADIFLEEVFEALSEKDPDKLETELKQCGAVIVTWLEKLRKKRR